MEMSRGHFVSSREGRAVELGVISMTLKAARRQTGGSFTLMEFAGAEGPWTVPHLHQHMEESFYVLEGTFKFRCGEDEFDAGPGCYVLIPRGAVHVMTAGPGGGRFLTLMVPGGLEDMFIELGELPPDSLRDSEVRAAISVRYDSIPAELPAPTRDGPPT